MKIKFLRVWVVRSVNDDGPVGVWYVGVGPDGSRWIDAALLGMGVEDLLDMARDTPGCLSRHPSGRHLVKVRAVFEPPRLPQNVEENLVELVRKYWDGSLPVIFWN
jgi:hypothetical protein